MYEGFSNFNAGTAGTSMIEGRISAVVFVGKGSDLGSGHPTIGTRPVAATSSFRWVKVA